MSYGSAADDERALTYAASKDPINNTSTTSSTSAPATTQPNGLHSHSRSHSSSPQKPKTSSSSSSPAITTATTTTVPFLEETDMPSSSSPTPAPSSTSPTSPSSFSTDRIVSYVRTLWSECRPWTEFYNTASINLPSFHHLSDRIASNLHIYRPNYLCITAFSLAFFVLFSIPSFLLAILAFFALDRIAARIARKHGGKIPHRDLILISLAALVIIWITGIAQHVLTSLFLSSLACIVHATVHDPACIETEIASV